jgi:uncharacterized Zn finger protein
MVKKRLPMMRAGRLFAWVINIQLTVLIFYRMAGYINHKGIQTDMNLSDFESCIDDSIRARGAVYYENGAVASLEFTGAKWVAEVSGSDDYTVTVSLSPSGEILESACDCPYNAGSICKHQVAVFHALRENGPEKIKQESLQT